MAGMPGGRNSGFRSRAAPWLLLRSSSRLSVRPPVCEPAPCLQLAPSHSKCSGECAVPPAVPASYTSLSLMPLSAAASSARWMSLAATTTLSFSAPSTTGRSV